MRCRGVLPRRRFTPADLPGYAGRLFDYLLIDPAVLRLSTWANLERPEATSGEIGAYRPKVEALREHADADAADVLALVLGLVTAWADASPSLRTLAADGPESPQRLERHRTAMTAAVAAVSRELERSAAPEPP
ncbi:hypothetical protein [Nocardia mexicana]|nr:hypothetical protein [Nocardia mexicana]